MRLQIQIIYLPQIGDLCECGIEIAVGTEAHGIVADRLNRDLRSELYHYEPPPYVDREFSGFGKCTKRNC